MPNDKYRPLTTAEIQQLEQNKNKAENWHNILVKEGFDAKRLENCRFSGKNRIGLLNESMTFFGNVTKHCGLYNAHFHNCTLGDNVFVNHVKNYIANYDIEDHVIIDNTDLLAVEGVSSFGNGIQVSVLDETGGRKVAIYDQLSAHLAYMLAFYKHRRVFTDKLEQLIDDYTEEKKADQGFVGQYSQIINCREIKNVKIGAHTIIDGCSKLENGSVNSNASAPVKLGHEIIMKDFIISSGSEVTDGAIVSNCFIGQGCKLGSQYSAENSLFFANCQGFHGEACALFAGPYTVTHHKSTLLIAGMFSFCNAGSGSNQSNHMYKLGPIHHGIVERGSKTTSDSYLLWPAKIGAFTMVMGRHYKNSDTSDMPFSYLIENKDESWLAPAINLKSVGTIRDVLKWPRRDKRTDPKKMDCVNFNLLSPFTIQKMAKGIRKLKEIQRISGETTEVFSYNNTKIKRTSLLRGIELYHMAIMKFIGNSIITRLNTCTLETQRDVYYCLKADSTVGKGNWIDLAGLIAPKHTISELLDGVEAGSINQLRQIEDIFYSLHDNYYNYEWNWTVDFIAKYFDKSLEDMSVEDIIQIIKEWQQSVVAIDKMLYSDAKKEFRLESMTGFGIDGDQKTKQLDFENVRGKFESNDFVREILNHIDRKTALGNRVIEQLHQTISREEVNEKL
ncbi:DUF4954 family protein [uncultured Sunxiuqinia sp.]|uniref:DUF4954 family protein n=1 Tax=uncultured Sunxiuqinia sp. TaxID=1573825 RepID=UPI0030D922D8|tara:strand:- start:9223 stop:11244 length:2022 start_codon:yes stop_codon:yes gene_type:complete